MFQNEIQERNIMGVPAVFLNGNEFGQDRMTLAEIVNKVDNNAEKHAELLNQKDAFDVLIVVVVLGCISLFIQLVKV